MLIDKTSVCFNAVITGFKADVCKVWSWGISFEKLEDEITSVERGWFMDLFSVKVYLTNHGKSIS
jgi:hypothetical protein